MIQNLSNIFSRKTVGILGCILLFGGFATLPLPWNEAIENVFIDLQFKLRGDHSLGDDIVLVFIGAEDVKTLGGWPITRDYYGYMTHVLGRLGAKVIGFYLMFDTSDPRYPEYDGILTGFFQSADNICLPMAFYHSNSDSSNEDKSKPSNRLLSGHNPILPLKQFREHVSGLGFSNLGKETVIHKVPLVAAIGDSFMLSFGCELARLFLEASHTVRVSPKDIIMTDVAGKQHTIPINHFGQMRLNHFGNIDRVFTIGFVDLLQLFESTPDSLDLDNKLVIVDVTAPGIATLQATPLASALPTSLIHATVAENILNQNFMRELSWPIHWIFILLLVISAWLIGQTNPVSKIIVGSLGILLFYWITATVLFSKANLILPLFYPTLAYIVTTGYLAFEHGYQRRSKEISIKTLLEEQIILKEAQLKEAKAKLSELQNQLQNESTISEQSSKLSEDRRKAIIELEKQLHDLQAYIVPEKQRPELKFVEIIHAQDSKMSRILELVAKVSSDDIPVLILGGTGTGKEMIAHAIHQYSKRKNASFVAVNCGALPETLLESELFGHEKGSFTGAHIRRKGRFELADGGTIFLDEIMETTPSFQARLLRVLQEGTFERLGGEQTIKVDVRVIAASNKDLQVEVEQGRFRTDLFYRLNGFPITIPPLHERTQDIPLLANHFLKKHGYESISGISEQSVKILQAYRWPGNVRELENVVRRAAILAQSEGRDLIQVNDLPNEIRACEESQREQFDYKLLDDQILEMLRALKFSRSAISQTARALGNRDRGTITEYFRGICFKQLVESNFDFEATTKGIAEINDEQIILSVRDKLNEYLKNLYPLPDSHDSLDSKVKKLPSQYKGLPKKYHPYLRQVIEYLRHHSIDY